MHDIRAIRDNPGHFVAGWSSRGVDGADKIVADILSLDTELRAAQTAGQEALAKRNAASKLIGAAMGRKDMAEADRLKAEVETLKGDIASHGEVEAAKGAELRGILAAQKNLAAEDVPDGEDEAGNVETSRWGTPRAGGPAKDHADLGEAMGLLDFEAAARMSGARFAVLKGGLARLERAVGQFMLDVQTTEHGYLEVNPPYLVRDEAMFGTGQLPKFKGDLFGAASFWQAYEDDRQEHTAELITLGQGPMTNPNAFTKARLTRQQQWGEKFESGEFKASHWLIPTAEVSLTNLVREQITPEEELPLRLTALTPCFRAEAGSAGRDTRGLIRQHQFHKV